MAVGANDFTLRDLFYYRIPVAALYARADIEGFLFDMVKLQNNDILLAAISAGMVAQILDDPFGSFSYEFATTSGGVVYVSLLVL